jgi:2'-5' RNA ligase
MPTQRLFIALPLPAPLREFLIGLTAPLHDVRWTQEEQLHLTLRFLGDTDEALVEPLLTRLAAIRVQSFFLPLEGVGAFPEHSAPRLLWAGVGAGHPRLHQLRQRIDDTLLSIGVDADLRRFHPHVTLARCGEHAASAAQQWVRSHREFAGPSFNVDAFELYASELRPQGAVHHLLERFALAPAGAHPSRP